MLYVDLQTDMYHIDCVVDKGQRWAEDNSWGEVTRPGLQATLDLNQKRSEGQVKNQFRSRMRFKSMFLLYLKKPHRCKKRKN